MATAEQQDLQAYCRQVAQQAKAASRVLVRLPGEVKNQWLRGSAAKLRESAEDIVQANSFDIEAAPGFGLTPAQIDRLRLDHARIDGIAQAMEEVAMLPDPVGETIEQHVRPNGLSVGKVRVPLGVVFFIYESRPNVTADAAAICVKSGNAVILRGGKEAAHSSQAIVELVQQVAVDHGIPEHAVQLVATSDREAVGHFLRMHEEIDLAIPRGGEGLIRRVSEEATMPVIKHFSGNCHVYVDDAADPAMAEEIVVNSKCQRLGVCNACESLLIHQAIAETMLPTIAAALQQAGIELRGCRRTCELIESAVPATEDDFFAEYLAKIISVKMVDSLDDAIAHINHYGSHHTDAIVTNNIRHATQFSQEVDSSAVMVNASTRFNDGGEFGLGAEIGISTDKFHARGPCGLRELTSYKYVVQGDGHTR